MSWLFEQIRVKHAKSKCSNNLEMKWTIVKFELRNKNGIFE